jgi:hypothetical protein
MTTASACFTREQLRDFSLGAVSAEAELEMVEHLEQCAACQEAAAEHDQAADSFICALRDSPNDGPSPPRDNSERRLVREYELLRKIGEGGMGTVYQARHIRLNRMVALKLLPPLHNREPSAVARFEREMRAVGALDHPALVRATDAGDENGVHFLAMELVDGIDLASLSDQLGPLQAADACELVRQAAEGLEHVHELGMVHRDVKPSNLMLTSRGVVKILDLGLALFSENGEQQHELTTVGRFLGSLDYMAPEQADDSHVVDIRADVYGLGATLYRLLCGTPPFGGPQFRSPLKKFRALALLSPPPIAERRRDVPVELARIVERMLAKAPQDRFATPREVAEALRPFVEGHDVAALYASVGRLRESARDEAEAADRAPRKPSSRIPPRRGCGKGIAIALRRPGATCMDLVLTPVSGGSGNRRSARPDRSRRIGDFLAGAGRRSRDSPGRPRGGGIGAEARRKQDNHPLRRLRGRAGRRQRRAAREWRKVHADSRRRPRGHHRATRRCRSAWVSSARRRR